MTAEHYSMALRAQDRAAEFSVVLSNPGVWDALSLHRADGEAGLCEDSKAPRWTNRALHEMWFLS